jgi:hypothetical protein
VPANASQLEYRIIWTPVGTAAAAETINFAQAKLEPGSQATPYIPPDPYVELQELSAFYWKTFGLGILPSQNAGLLGTFAQMQATAAVVANTMMPRWPTRMIKPPTVITYNPSATNTQVRNANVPADCTSVSVGNVDEAVCIQLSLLRRVALLGNLTSFI